MKSILVCLVVTLIACGSKSKPAATPQNNEAGGGSGSAATCCCELADKSTKMEAPADCKTGGGTCQATEDSCHGIEGPIP